jgi:hypothetical protein
MPPQPGAGRPGPRAIAQALGFLRHSPVLAGAFLTDLNATIFGLPIALFPAINAERFGGNPATLGLFTTAIGAGGLASAVLAGPVGRTARQGAVMLATFAMARPLWLLLGTLALAGAADTVTVVLRGTIVQSVATDELRGRLTAAEYVIGMAGDSLGRLESGTVGSLTSPTIGALSGGVVTVVLAGAIALAMPTFARYRSPSATAREVTGPPLPAADQTAPEQT